MSDKIYVVQLPDNKGRIECTDEARARESLAAHPGATFGYRPFPSTVKLPWIEQADLTVEDHDYGLVLTYTPLGVYGCGDDYREAYSALLRAIREHLEAATLVALP